jgi:hypothetical protein
LDDILEIVLVRLLAMIFASKNRIAQVDADLDLSSVQHLDSMVPKGPG